MITTEILAISAIFLAGLYLGLKIRKVVEVAKIYFSKNRKNY